MIADMNFLQRVVYIFHTYAASLAKGTWTTMAIAVVCTALGCVIGFAVGVVQTIELKHHASVSKWSRPFLPPMSSFSGEPR